MKNFFKKKKDQAEDIVDDFEDERLERVNADEVRDRVKDIEEEDVDEVIDKEESIAHKITNSNVLKSIRKEGKLMIAMIKDYRRGIYKEVPWFTIGAVTATLLYILNPVDIIPDFIMGLGFIDDFAVFSIVHGWIQSDLQRYEDWKLEHEGLQED